VEGGEEGAHYTFHSGDGEGKDGHGAVERKGEGAWVQGPERELIWWGGGTRTASDANGVLAC